MLALVIVAAVSYFLGVWTAWIVFGTVKGSSSG
jgi:hypothetical protein